MLLSSQVPKFQELDYFGKHFMYVRATCHIMCTKKNYHYMGN